jgi:2-keto-3-deoxy-L-rhamnonate aldolase RhmA
VFDAINEFRRRLHSGEVLLGAGVYMTDPQSSAALADSADFLWFDLEHQAMSIDVLRAHLLTVRNSTAPSIVRVPPFDGALVQNVLDAGAHGIVAAQVRTVDEVAAMVAECRYPPTGRRGYWPMLPTNYCRDDADEYIKQADNSLFAAVMIETAEAVEAIDEIVTIAGLDAIVLGLMDLSGAYGVLGQGDHPKVVAAMDKVIASARAAGLPVGCGQGTDAQRICSLAKRGVQWFQAGADCLYLVAFMDQLKAAVQERLGKPE